MANYQPRCKIPSSALNLAVAGRKGNVLPQVSPSALWSERRTLFWSFISPFHSLLSEVTCSSICWALIYFSAKDQKQANKQSVPREISRGIKRRQAPDSHHSSQVALQQSTLPLFFLTLNEIKPDCFVSLWQAYFPEKWSPRYRFLEAKLLLTACSDTHWKVNS